MTDGLHTPAHTSSHMSPAEAAQVAGVSRWTIMRAIKAHDLLAVRDNRNHWKIDREELGRWCAAHCAHSVPAQVDLHTPHTSVQDTPETLAKLAAETARADAAERARDQAETDRDAWRAVAERLAERPARRGWWPWSR